jgi:broad specificity phosphatase PhoE
MRKEYASLRRRPFLAPVWILSIGAILALGIGVWALKSATTTLVVVVRHADKVGDGSVDPPLTPAGIERAQRLAAFLGTGGPDLGIDAIFVTQFQRSVATAHPLATLRGIPMIPLNDSDISGLEHRITHDFRGQRVLVVAHSDTIQDIVKTLGNGIQVPAIESNEYGTAYVIAIPRWNRPTVLRLSLP